MIRHILAALLLISPVAVSAQDSLTGSTAPAPTQVRLPLVRTVQDGERVVLQVVGSTTAPIGATNGLYIGPNGYTPDVSAAQDVRGLPGVSGTDVETVGPQGPMGAPGKSAYQLWLDAGNNGSRDQFLASLRGVQGGPGVAGQAGATGKSAYDLWIDAGNTGTAQQFLDSLAGRPGADGVDGQPGAAGPAGPAAEMRVSGGFIQWRAGGAWSNLVSLADLRGTDGAPGPKGDKGDTGATGGPGATPQLAIGTVTTLSPGSQATAALRGTTTYPILDLGLPAGATGATGATGAQGPAAATGVVFLNNIALTQTAVVAISLGPRTLTVATNCQVGDRLVMTPAAAMPAGYMLGDIFCSAAGTAQATLYAPALAIGATYTITARVVAFR